MIFDKVENISLYKGMHRALDVAIEHVLCHDAKDYEADSPVYLGDSGVYFSTAHVALRGRDEVRWECHDEYIDLQYVIDGHTETIDYASRDSLARWEKKPDGDIYFSDDGSCGLPLPVKPGFFAIFFPQDAHRPAQGKAGEESVKIVYKIPCKG